MRGAYNEVDPFAAVQSRMEQWNSEVEKQHLIGPILHGITSFAVEGPHEMFSNSPSFFNCSTPADAVELVRYLKKRNITLIKVYNHIPREAFFALMQEATKAGIDVAGHKPLRVSTIEASNAGMKSLEHAMFFIWDSYPMADSIRRLNNPSKAVSTAFRKEMLATHDSVMLQKMFTTFKKNATWYCPTHLTRKQDAFAGDEFFRTKYAGINPVLRFISFEDLDATLQEDTTSEAKEVYKAIYLKGLQISGAAYRSGVKILAGSDVPELPGSSLHEELTELSKTGMPNFEVLRTATLYPAQYYGLDSTYGSIREGKKGDLILVSKNPLTAIENTQTITSVFVDGKHFDEAFLNEVRQKVSKSEKSIVMSAKLIWDIVIYMSM
ncbi:amidohydrolase family protein [Telluribacter sp. SYSU D00476]|uniref:amidohydrolase family protein n=1 Tax=Telluribacter sp. SYSU D00476 TaxID=2811430 RepID=UPI001FF30657|nr:amidohydrolase family protein [Telluribacter sp. SYSU D00476]